MNEKEFIKRITVCVLLILLCAFAVYFIIGTRKDIHNNGHGADKVRNELTNATNSQREEASVIDDTAESISRSQKAVTNSEQANREIADTERKDAEIVDECEQILARVRERKATGN